MSSSADNTLGASFLNAPLFSERAPTPGEALRIWNGRLESARIAIVGRQGREVERIARTVPGQFPTMRTDGIPEDYPSSQTVHWDSSCLV